MSYRVLIADDHALMREGLRLILARQTDLEVVGEAENGRQAVELARKLAPDAVIMDIAMNHLNGIEATRQIRSANPQIKVIGLSAYSDARYVLGMLEAGSSGFVLKSSASSDLIQAIRAVREGRLFMSPDIAGLVVDAYVKRSYPGHAPGFSTLGAKEREVLQLLAEGKSSKEIADCLSISPKTVETHRRNIMRKLDIHSVALLTKFAIREGLTPLEG